MVLTKLKSEGIKDGEVKNADMADDAVGVAELSATGTASSSTFLRGDNSWAIPTDTNTVTTINNNADNRVITGSGTANTLEGEANLTWDATTLKVQAATPAIEISGTNSNGGNSSLHFNANANHWVLEADNYTQQNAFSIKSGTTASSTHRLTINSSGKVGINTSSPVGKLTIDENNASEHFQLRNTTNTSNFSAFGVDTSFNLRFYVNQSEQMRIDSGGKTFVRTTSGGDSLAGIRSKANFGLDGSSIDYAHSCYEAQLTHNAGSAAKKGSLLSGWDGTIQATAIGQNYDGTGYNLSLATNNNTSDRPTERLRIERTGNVKVLDGNLVIGASGHGIDFSDTSDASGMSNELLDDYEEGSFTPVITFGGNSAGQGYHHQNGRYTKIGNRCYVTLYVQLNTKGSSTGTARIAGMPYTTANVANLYQHGSVWMNGWVTGNTVPTGYGEVNTTTFRLERQRADGAGNGISGMDETNLTNTTDIMISWHYQVN